MKAKYQATVIFNNIPSARIVFSQPLEPQLLQVLKQTFESYEGFFVRMAPDPSKGGYSTNVVYIHINPNYELIDIGSLLKDTLASNHIVKVLWQRTVLGETLSGSFLEALDELC